MASRPRSPKGLRPEIGAKMIRYINLVIDQNLCTNLLWFPGDIFWGRPGCLGSPGPGGLVRLHGKRHQKVVNSGIYFVLR